MWKKILCMVWGMLFLCGCESVELEERSFPLAVGVDLQEDIQNEEQQLIVSFDFPDLAQISEKGKTTDTPMGMSLEGPDLYHVEKSYENNTNRLLDYNHMKAIVLGENVMNDSSQLREILLAWEQQENAARNISLFLGKGSAAEILSLTQETEGSMGKYLEEMLDSQKDFRQNKIVAIGNLMNQWHNQDELLLIPVLTKQGNRPAITGYGAVLNFEYKGILSVEESMEIFLCQNLLEKFTYEGAENDVVEISELQVTSSVEDTKDGPFVTVHVSGKGRRKTGRTSSAAQQYQLERRIEKRLTAQLQATAEKLRQDYGIDITNSYITLGGQNRGLYLKYKGLPDQYNKQVRQAFQVEVDLLNW
ncbi:MAG: hypothetical protein HFI74_10780 [Lachnospiraceae bacterium]|jgi:hypothetical protein|nr:hypothetical protein [Lachnospiraceae bacterium]